jgi:hypothetical protein
MKIPRDLSGTDLVRILCRDWVSVVVETNAPSHQRIEALAHKSFCLGTLNAILKAVATHKGVERAEILRRL